MPAPIPQLIALRELDLSGNKLSLIPTSISRLAQLRVLLISDNTLADLPEAVGDLAALATLAVDGNCLTSWPKRLERCCCLEVLHAHHNPALPPPPCLQALTALTTLTLNNNADEAACNGGAVGLGIDRAGLELAEGGEGEGCSAVAARTQQQPQPPQQRMTARNLLVLNMSCNLLKALPALVSSASTPLLQELDLSHNLIDALPASIGALECLTTLHLHHNRLRQLPPSLSRTLVARTHNLTLAGNPLVHPFPLPLPAAPCPAVAHPHADGGRAAGGAAAGTHPLPSVRTSEPPRAWLSHLMSELWELDRAKTQRLALSLVAFGPATCDLKLRVLDALFSSTPADKPPGERGRSRSWLRSLWRSSRRRPQAHDGDGCGDAGGADIGAEVGGEEVLVEHSRRVVDAGGQQVHLRIAAAGAAAGAVGDGCGGACAAGCGGRVRRAGSGQGVEGSGAVRSAGSMCGVEAEAAAMRAMVADDVLPARMLPLFVWQSDAPSSLVCAPLTYSRFPPDFLLLAL